MMLISGTDCDLMGSMIHCHIGMGIEYLLDFSLELSIAS